MGRRPFQNPAPHPGRARKKVTHQPSIPIHVARSAIAARLKRDTAGPCGWQDSDFRTHGTVPRWFLIIVLSRPGRLHFRFRLHAGYNPGMNEERNPVWPWIAALLIGLPVLYVASFGPAC